MKKKLFCSCEDFKLSDKIFLFGIALEKNISWPAYALCRHSCLMLDRVGQVCLLLIKSALMSGSAGSCSQVLLVQVAFALNLRLNLIINSWIKLYICTHMQCYVHIHLSQVTSKIDQIIQIYLISLNTAKLYHDVIIKKKICQIS